MSGDGRTSLRVGSQQEAQRITNLMLNRDTVDAVLFDLDGTLMDTDDQAVERLALRLQKLRWPHPHRAARRLFMALESPGNAILTLLDMFRLDGPTMGLFNRLRRWRGASTKGNFRIVAGVEGMLAELDGRYRLAVVTTREAHEAEAFLNQYDLRERFEAIVTRESTWRLKPHPEPIRYVAEMLDVPVERCVMVGDTTVDVRAARRAGAKAVGVLCGFGEREELERCGAQAILECTSQLSSLL